MPFPKNPALEAAVIADAEDDLPRLVYADWLDEHGDPARAAFIRAQCAMWEKNPADEDYPDLMEQWREACDGVWCRSQDLRPTLPAAAGYNDTLSDQIREWSDHSYQRGFPYLAKEPYVEGWIPSAGREAYADRFAAALPELFATTTLRGLLLDWFTAGADRILSAAECARFTSLETDYREADTVARSPICSSLRCLNLGLPDAPELTALAEADLPHLRRLKGAVTGPAAAVKRLLGCDWFGRLEHIQTHLTEANAAAIVAALAGCPRLHTWDVGRVAGCDLSTLGRPGGFRTLGRLRLWAPKLDGENVRLLKEAEFPKLAVLEMRRAVRNDHLKTLMTADWFSGLRVLELICDELGDETIVPLGRSPAAANLRSLALDTPKIGMKAFASLLRDYPNLTTLDLALSLHHKVTPIDPAASFTAFSLTRLRHLSLTGWPVGDDGAVTLAANPALATLMWLDLRRTRVGAKGVRALLESPHLQRLVSLNLIDCPGGAGVEALADPGVLPNLAFCGLPNYVPKAVYDGLVHARGDIFVNAPW